MIVRLAFKNIIGSGIRTWSNVSIIAIVFFLILWTMGIFVGWIGTAYRCTKAWEISGGQYISDNFDRYDSFSYDDGHSDIPPELQLAISSGEAVPVLVSAATIYPNMRMRSVLLKGISANQNIIEFPSAKFAEYTGNAIPIILGRFQAKNWGIAPGESMMMRWRDANGAFDATEVELIAIIDSKVPAIETGQVWMDYDKLLQVKQLSNQATIIVMKDTPEKLIESKVWKFHTPAVLLIDLRNITIQKVSGAVLIFILLLFLAMIAIFDTQ
ncbi:MAG: ABC transporter permease, partial [Candidatus Cloacimonetes bacterium]|nr:ABC transporter permease [Candidatus Cloacimonadota bacterium]